MEDYSSAKLKACVQDGGGVVSLNLSGKGLSRVPDAVTELTEAEELKLDDNNLTELPTSINKLKNLIMLDLSGNKLTKLEVLKSCKATETHQQVSIVRQHFRVQKILGVIMVLHV